MESWVSQFCNIFIFWWKEQYKKNSVLVWPWKLTSQWSSLSRKTVLSGNNVNFTCNFSIQLYPSRLSLFGVFLLSVLAVQLLRLSSLPPPTGRELQRQGASKSLAQSGFLPSSLHFPLSFSLCCSRFVVPPLMCKWLDDRVEGKHKLCFLGSGHAWNSSGFTAVRIPQILSG